MRLWILQILALLAVGALLTPSCTGAFSFDDDDGAPGDDDSAGDDDDASATPPPTPTDPPPTPTGPPPTPPPGLECGLDPMPYPGQGEAYTYTGAAEVSVGGPGGGGEWGGCEIMWYSENGQLLCYALWRVSGPLVDQDWGTGALVFDLEFVMQDDTCGLDPGYQNYGSTYQLVPDMMGGGNTAEVNYEGQNGWETLDDDAPYSFDWAQGMGAVEYKGVFGG